ncbi:hypothetical protein [Photobacterium damselae]|uniref:hypothetical protein n=1 Tax=Photobacterium damselae TaxID=38293 RepID=UPI0040682B58
MNSKLLESMVAIEMRQYKDIDTKPMMAQVDQFMFDGTNVINFTSIMNRPQSFEIEAIKSLRAGIHTNGDFAFLVVASDYIEFSAQINTKKLDHHPEPFYDGAILNYTLTDSRDSQCSYTTSHKLPIELISKLNELVATQANKTAEAISKACDNEESHTGILKMLRSSKPVHLTLLRNKDGESIIHNI